MFTSLRWLRVCDIYTWNNDADGRKSEFPNNILHCRRRFGGSDQGDYVTVKILWISSIATSGGIRIRTTVSERCFDLKLGDGENGRWDEYVAAFVVKETIMSWDVAGRFISYSLGTGSSNMSFISYPSYSRNL